MDLGTLKQDCDRKISVMLSFVPLRNNSVTIRGVLEPPMNCAV